MGLGPHLNMLGGVYQATANDIYLQYTCTLVFSDMPPTDKLQLDDQLLSGNRTIERGLCDQQLRYNHLQPSQRLPAAHSHSAQRWICSRRVPPVQKGQSVAATTSWRAYCSHRVGRHAIEIFTMRLKQFVT